MGRMDNFAYTSKIGDNAKFVYPPTSEQNAKFGYMKLYAIDFRITHKDSLFKMEVWKWKSCLG